MKRQEQDIEMGGNRLVKTGPWRTRDLPLLVALPLVDACDRRWLILTGQKRIKSQSFVTNGLPLQESMLAFAGHKKIRWLDRPL
jgi:hypothetical protein